MKEQEIIPGTQVRCWKIIMESGEKLDPVDTVIKTTPWKLPAGQLVCIVEGINGCVLVSHLEKL